MHEPTGLLLRAIQACLILGYFSPQIQAAVASFTSVDFPGASSTFVTAVGGNRVAGSYRDSNGVSRAFTWDGSAYTTLNPPGATRSEATGIDGNRVVGWYDDTAGQSRAFVWNGSAYTTLFPGTPGGYSVAVGAGNGYVSGRFGVSSGFLWDGVNYRTINSPGIGGPVVMGNDGTNAVGYYATGSSGQIARGFLWNGQTTTLLDYPLAAETQPNAISGMNVVGQWIDQTQKSHGFLWNGSSYASIDPPGSTYTVAVRVSGNHVVGQFLDAAGQHGFFWDGAQYLVLDSPAGTQISVTGVSGDKVAGFYGPAGGPWRGFIVTVPEPTAVTLLAATAAAIAHVRPRRNRIKNP